MFALVLALTISGTIEVENEVKLIAPLEDICLDSVEFHADQEVYIEGNRITFKNGGRYYGPKFHFKGNNGIFAIDNSGNSFPVREIENEWVGIGVTIANLKERTGEPMSISSANVYWMRDPGKGVACCGYKGYLAGKYFSTGEVFDGITFENVTLEGEAPKPEELSEPSEKTSEPSQQTHNVSTTFFCCSVDLNEEEEEEEVANLPESKLVEEEVADLQESEIEEEVADLPDCEEEKNQQEIVISENIKQYIQWDEQE